MQKLNRTKGAGKLKPVYPESAVSFGEAPQALPSDTRASTIVTILTRVNALIEPWIKSVSPGSEVSKAINWKKEKSSMHRSLRQTADMVGWLATCHKKSTRNTRERNIVGSSGTPNRWNRDQVSSPTWMANTIALRWRSIGSIWAELIRDLQVERTAPTKMGKSALSAMSPLTITPGLTQWRCEIEKLVSSELVPNRGDGLISFVTGYLLKFGWLLVAFCIECRSCVNMVVELWLIDELRRKKIRRSAAWNIHLKRLFKSGTE